VDGKTVDDAEKIHSWPPASIVTAGHAVAI